MSAVLVTGFEPFGGHAANPSRELAERLGRAPGRAAAVLPVAYARADALLPELVATHRPRAWLVLGLCAEARGLRLERTARNLDQSDQADNEGEVRCGRTIAEGGPASYASTLPLAEWAGRLDREGVPVEWSDDAGGYLCNHVFYAARHALARSLPDAVCGLVHVPPGDAMDLGRQQRALEICLEALG